MKEEEWLHAVAIAFLIGADDDNVVGAVYRWNNGDLSVMWNENRLRRVSRIEPDLSDAEKQEIGFAEMTKI